MVNLLTTQFNPNRYSILRKLTFDQYRCSSTKMSSFDYCLNSVRNRDYENFICSLLLPEEIRNASLILRAFNVEIASVQDQITETIAGQMRFQFWEDTIDNMYAGKIREHPVCIELAKVISKSNLSKIYLKRLVTSRKNYLLSPHFGSLSNIEDYAEMSNSPIYYLLLEIGGIQQVDADHAASHLGKAQGITNLLRSTMYNSERNIVSIPQEILVEHEVSQEDILRKKINTNTKDVFFKIASQAHLHLKSVQNLQKKLDQISRYIFLPNVALESYLKKLEALDFDVFHPKLQRKNEFLPLKLYWKKLFL